MSSAPAANLNTGVGRFVTVVSWISALAGLLFGYDTGVISGAILFVKPDFSLSTFQEEVVVAAVLVGAIIGAIGTALAPTTTWLAIGRVVVGIAIGVASFTAPLYISEVSPPQVRGKLVSLDQLMITIGI